MADYLKIPFINPFKFLPVKVTPGIHFDDDWAYKQIKDFEMTYRYFQKWVKSDDTYLQIESTIAPNDLKVLDPNGTVVYSASWQPLLTGLTAYTIYQLNLNLSSLSEGKYFLYQKATNGTLVFESITEPIYLRASWPGTLLFKYKHFFNDYGVYWLDQQPPSLPRGYMYMQFRCEAGIMDFQPERERTSYVNQVHDTATLHGVPWRSWKLYIGDVFGVAPWVLDVLNRIFCCSYVLIEGKQYQTTDGSKWEVTRVKGFPTEGASIEITEAFTADSLMFSSEAVPGGGANPSTGTGDTGTGGADPVTGYHIETGFFGPGSLVPVIDIEKQIN